MEFDKRKTGREWKDRKQISPIIKEIRVKNILTKSNLPVCEYSVNPYVGCTHGCKYCYASFMKRFTGHAEPWGTFLDIKYWQEIKNPKKYAGKELFIGSVTDPYLPQEEIYGRTRALLEQLKGQRRENQYCDKKRSDSARFGSDQIFSGSPCFMVCQHTGRGF